MQPPARQQDQKGASRVAGTLDRLARAYDDLASCLEDAGTRSRVAEAAREAREGRSLTSVSAALDALVASLEQTDPEAPVWRNALAEARSHRLTARLLDLIVQAIRYDREAGL